MNMPRARYAAFEPFCLDRVDERLWKDGVSIPLGYKAFAVLGRLVSRPDQLVTKDDLLASVWPDVSVSEAVLSTAMREIRAAIGDTARTPRFVQTVHGRGYRFIATVSETGERPARLAPLEAAGAFAEGTRGRPSSLEAGLVGRQAEWARLCEWYQGIQQGMRRLGLIAGEAGIGKTALVETFLARIASAGAVCIGRGQCVEQYGGGEAYLPILDALGRLGRDSSGSVARVLRECAPSWLAHLPSLAISRAVLSGPVRPERMLRELTEAIERLTGSEALILVLEDLHWSDRATLEWLSHVFRRRDPARLLVLATYRPVEVLLHRSPLRDLLAELRHQPQTAEIVLDYLPREAVRALIRRRCGAAAGGDALVDLLHQRTGGHPLFVTSLVDELMQRRSLSGADAPCLDVAALTRTIPLNVRQFLEHRFEQLSEEDQTILEAASVAGNPFSVAAVAAATSLSEDRIEARCAAWTRNHRMLDEDGIAALPDGTLEARYRFRHDLFQETAYARISPERRARFHHLIGSRLELAYGRHATSMAAELAVHFEQGRDRDKAVSYLEHAARNAVRRSAYSEADHHLVRALRIVESLPDDRARLRREATLSLLLAQVLETTKGWGAVEVAHAYSRARELSLALRDEPRILQSTWGLVAGCIVRAELGKTEDLTRDILKLATKRNDATFTMAAHTELGGTALALGRTTAARRHFRQAEALCHPGQRRSGLSAFGMDMGIFARIWATHLMWYQGYPERARARAEETVRAATELGHPFTLTITLAYAAMLCQFLRDVVGTDRLATATIAQATEHGFPYYLAWAEVLRGWSRAALGKNGDAVDVIRRGIEVLQTTARLRLPYYRSLLAESYGRIGRFDEGLDIISQALDDVGTSEERWWDPELHRTRGTLLCMAARDTEAERCFRTAIAIARAQRAAALELRATVALAQLSQRQGKSRQAIRELTAAYHLFTEGYDTADLRDARALLETCTPGP
jgi:DNA-binding winged helix-turn-helix (wHTH) protein